MVLLKKIQLDNFLSHEKSVIDFQEEQQVLIDGKSGAGKSSVIDAISWCLYGKARADNRSLIRRGRTKAKVTMILLIDGEEYMVERSITDAGKHDLSVLKKDGEKYFPVQQSGLKVLQEFIEEELLKCSYLLFVNSVAYLQGNENSFVNQTATKRKEIILEIIKGSSHDEFLDKAKKKISEVNDLIGSTNTEILVRLETASKVVEYADLLHEEEKLLPYDREELKSAEELLKNLEVESNKAVEADLRLAKATERYSNLFSSLSSLYSKRTALQDRLKGIVVVDNGDLATKTELLNAYISEKDSLYEKNLLFQDFNSKWMDLKRREPSLIDYDVKIAEINEIIKKFQLSPRDKCPNCNFDLGNKVADEKIAYFTELLSDNLVKQKEQEIIYSSWSQEMKALESVKCDDVMPELNAVMAKIRALESEKKLLEEAEANKRVADEINSQLSDVEKEIKVIEGDVAIAKEEKDIISNEVLLFAGIEAKKKSAILAIDSIKQSITRRELSMEHLNEMIIKSKEASNIVNDLKNKLSGYKSDLIALETIKDAFGNNGIKNIIVDLVVPQLEERINDILAKMSDFRISLDTQRSGVSGDTMIDGLFIDIINDQGEVLDILNYSGGEKLKIVVAIAEGLASLQKIGFRIFDEIFFALDEDSSEGFVNVMMELQNQFKQLLCISHLRNIKDMFEDFIEVKKVNGISIIN